jgi:hypothetical protein
MGLTERELCSKEFILRRTNPSGRIKANSPVESGFYETKTIVAEVYQCTNYLFC